MAEKVDIEQMREIFELFSEKLPAVLESLTDVLYGKASAEKYGQAASNFYKTLRESGMTEKQAFKLTEQYMSSLNFGKILGETVGRNAGRHGGPAKHKVPAGTSRHSDE